MDRLQLYSTQEWTDINLIWNKSEYGDVADIRIPPKYIWKPDLLMYNRWDSCWEDTGYSLGSEHSRTSNQSSVIIHNPHVIPMKKLLCKSSYKQGLDEEEGDLPPLTPPLPLAIFLHSGQNKIVAVDCCQHQDIFHLWRSFCSFFTVYKVGDTDLLSSATS